LIGVTGDALLVDGLDRGVDRGVDVDVVVTAVVAVPFLPAPLEVF
jgi:hypothetical protein